MRYLGIVNGIVFRIDSAVDNAGRTVGLVSLETDAAAASKGVAAAPLRRRPAVHAGPLRSADALNLFPRDGAEPLRAGHPDLWNLLVAGTCLEGSTFRTG
jgi:hypothetical protein